MRELVATIRNVEVITARPIGILVDLQGPKLRLAPSRQWRRGSSENGAMFTLDSDPRPRQDPSTYPVKIPPRRCGRPVRFLIDDGKLRLIAEETSADHALLRVNDGRTHVGPQRRQPARYRPANVGDDAQGPPRSRSGGAGAGIDWIALSFVQRADTDVVEAKKLVRGRASIMSRSRSRRPSSASPTSWKSGRDHGRARLISASDFPPSAFPACRSR